MVSDLTLDEKRLAAKRKLATMKLEQMQAETAQPQEPDIMQQLSGRGQESLNLKQMRQSGEITRPEEIVRSAGQGAGAIMDVSGAALGAADDFLANIPSKALGAGASALGSLPIPMDERNMGEYLTDAVQSGMGQYSEFKQERPRTAGVLEGVANIASVGISPLTKKPIKETGDALIEAGNKQAFKKYTDLAAAKITPKVRKEAQSQGRLSQSMIGRDVIDATEVEKRAANLMKDMQGLKGLPKTLSKKGKVVQSEAYKIVDDLSQSLRNQGAIIPKREVLSHIDKTAVKNIFDNPMITTASGSSETARKLVTQFGDLLDQSDGTLAGLLKVRQDFDKIAKQYKSDVFDSTSENAYSIATREIRNSINDLIDVRAPNQAVKERLRDASSLLDAADNIADKVSSQRDTGIKRGVAALEEAIPGKSEMGDIAIGGAAAYTANKSPAIALIAGTLYAGGKALNSSQSKKLIGNILSKGSGVIDVGTKDILQDYLNELQQQEDEALNQPVNNGINNKQEVR